MSFWHQTLKAAIPQYQQRNRRLRSLLQQLVAGNEVSRHSAQGLTLPFLITGLEEARIPYRLDAIPGVGYLLTRLPESSQPRR